MKLVVQVQAVPEESQALLNMMRQFNAACNYLSAIAFSEKIFSWLKLQRRAYHEVRANFGLSAAQTVVAVRKVAYSYRNKQRRTKQASFKPLGAMPLYQHQYKRDGTVALYGLRMPFKVREGVMLSSRHQATLSYQNERFSIFQVIEVKEPLVQAPQGFLGADLGIVNILADSDGELYSGALINGLRKRHVRLRQRLQKKGTRSCKRLLRKRSGKEKRFARHVNHTISKNLVAKAHDTGRGIALEDLKGIRSRIKVRKAQRHNQHSWSFGQLRQFIAYKAALAGVHVAIIDPRNTSRMCPQCGAVDKTNRVSQSMFCCQSCGFSGHADIIAAGIIARRALGDAPYMASSQMDSYESA